MKYRVVVHENSNPPDISIFILDESEKVLARQTILVLREMTAGDIDMFAKRMMLSVKSKAPKIEDQEEVSRENTKKLISLFKKDVSVSENELEDFKKTHVKSTI